MTGLRRYWPSVVLVVLLALNGLVVWQRQWIGDWIRLRDYDPPAAIAKLADEVTMTGKSKRYFYINHPILAEKQVFNTQCSDSDEETAVLGCYHGDRAGIYLYDVQDERLHGVKEVTAAHEMLHQAYDRLNTRERERVDGLLLGFFESGLKESDVRTKIDSYKKQKNVVLASEMHSIFGSEVRQLTPELETYYKQFFTDRTKVVKYSEAYQGEFTRRKQLVDSYDKQLESLKISIDKNKAALESRLKTLKSKEVEINDDLSQQNNAEYQADVESYNGQVTTYNNLIVTTRGLIDEYNTVVAKRNDIAIEERQLQQALDSRLSPAETQ
jgi:hypothetical protein